MLCTIGEIMALQNERQTIVKRKKQNMQKTKKSGHRHLTFEPSTNYTCIRKGNTKFTTKTEIHNQWKEEKLCEAQLFHFCHNDPWVKRKTSSKTLKYVAAFCLNDSKTNETFVIPHQCHFQQIYSKLNRRDASCGETIMPDGTPYWTDIYLKRIERKKSHKKRAKN